MTRSTIIVGLLCAGLTATACEPASVTDARDQLGRGGDRLLAFTIPISNDTFTVGEILEDFVDVTIGDIGGLASIAIQAESIAVAVGDELRFDNIGFDQFVFGFDQMLRTGEVGTSETLTLAPPAPAPAPGLARAPQQAQIQFTTPDGSSVTSATVDTGTVVRTLTNNTSCDANVTLTLKDGTGAVVVAFGATAVNAGQSITDSLAINNVTVDQFVELELTGSAVLPCVPVPGESVSADVTFRAMTLSQVTLGNVQEDFTQQYDVLASETRLNAVDTVYVATGNFALNIQNRLPVAITVDLVLNGVLNVAGQAITTSTVVPAAPGDGTTTTASLTVNLAGTRVVPASAQATVTGTVAAVNATITPTVATDAVVVDGTGSIEVAALAGVLDPAATPELTVAIEEAQELPRGNLDLGEFESVIRDATLNTVRLAIRVTNDANIPITLNNFQIGAVRIDLGTGLPQRDVGNNLVYEQDAGGNPIIVDTTVTLTGAGTTSIVFAGSESVDLINRLVDLLLDDVRVALVGSGTAVVGDGVTRARITSSDAVSVVFELEVGLDITLPPAGAQFESSTIAEGLSIDSTDREEVIRRVDTATVTLAVTNATPFGVQALIAVVGDSGATNVFAQPGRVDLTPVSVAAASVNAQGQVVTPVSTSVTLSLTGQQLRVFLNDWFTAGIRITIVPPQGQRGAIRTTDRIIVRSSAQVRIRTGGGQ